MNYECPFCNYCDTYDGDPLGDGDTAEVECAGCGQSFIVEAQVTVDLTVRCKDEDHAWAVVDRLPIHEVCQRCQAVKVRV